MQSIAYSELFSILRESGQSLKDYMTLLRNIIARKDFNFKANAEEVMIEPIRLFSLNVSQRWRKSGRNYNTFMKTNAAWLENNFFIPKEALEVTYNCDESSTSTAQKLKPFSQLSCRQKKRCTEALRVGNTPEELTFAAKLSMQAAGNKDIAAVLSYLIANPEDATRIELFARERQMKRRHYTQKKKH